MTPRTTVPPALDLAEVIAEFETAAALSAHGLTLSDPEGRFVLVNAAFAELLGRSEVELLGTRYQDVTHPQDNQPSAITTQGALSRGERGVTIDKRYLRADGTAVHVRVSSTIVRDEDGEPVCYVNQVTDLTELLRERTRSRTAEDRAQRVIASATDAYISINAAGRVQEWSPAAVRLFGWSREAALGSDVADLLIPAEYRDAHHAGLHRYGLTGKSEILGRTLDLTALRADGAPFPVEVTIWATEEGDGTQSYHAFLRDVSERVQAAEESRRHALVFAAIGDAVFLTGPDGRIVETNPAGQALFGRSREQLIGATSASLLDADSHVDPVQVRAAATTDGVWAADVPFTRPDGARRISAAVVRPLTSADGTRQGYLAVHRDVTDSRAATAALVDAEARWRLTFDHAPIGIALLGLDGKWLRVNHAMCRLTGYPEPQLMALTFQDITHPEDLGADLAVVARLLDGEIDQYQLDKRYFHADGHTVWVSLTATLFRDTEGAPLHFIAEIEDITPRRAAAAELAASEARYRLLAQNSSDIITQTATDGTVLYVSPSYERIFGRSSEEFVGGPLLNNVHPDDQAALRDAVATVLAGIPARLQVRRQRADGSWVWLESHSEPMRDPDSGDIVGVQSASRDITERRAAEAELERLALTDALTGLANRPLLADRLAQAQHRLRREPGHLALLMLDLDRFKLINDTLGHAAGDALLIAVAARLRACARPTDTVARLGGDEFVILLDRLTDPNQAQVVAQRILDALREPLHLPGQPQLEPLAVRGSVGIATTANPDQPTESLFREADLALYRAKEHGRDRYALFDTGLRQRVLAQVEAERQVRRALTDGLFVLHYQPVLRLPGQTVVGSEALIRLRDPDTGQLVMPGEFIEAAEETGLITEIDHWVLRQAVRDLAAPADHDGLLHAVGINVTPRSMLDHRFADRVADTLSEHGVDPARLLIEVTERTLMDTTGSALRSLQGLREQGVRVGLDDFGTGYSSLGYLQRLPLDFLKIDRSFTGQLTDSTQAHATVQAITTLAHAHHLTVTAEGVETQSQLQAVIAIGCDHAQGYYTGRPRPLND